MLKILGFQYSKLTETPLKRRTVIHLLHVDTRLFEEEVKSLLTISLLYNSMQVGIQMGEKAAIKAIFLDDSLIAWIKLAGGGQFDMLFKYLYKLSLGKSSLKGGALDAALRVCNMMADHMFFDYSSRLIADSGGADICLKALDFAVSKSAVWNPKVCKFFENLIYAILKVN